jgi:hypothetical protein
VCVSVCVCVCVCACVCDGGGGGGGRGTGGDSGQLHTGIHVAALPHHRLSLTVDERAKAFEPSVAVSRRRGLQQHVLGDRLRG